MTTQFLFDITRTCLHPISGVPTGIDRADFSYGYRFFVEDVSRNPASVVTTPLATGVVRSEVARKHFRRIRHAWGGSLNASDVAGILDKICEIADDHFSAARAGPVRLQFPLQSSLLSAIIHTPLRDLPLAQARLKVELSATKGSQVYFHASHLQLPFARRFQWLKKGNVPAVFFVHDAIPLEYPEFVGPGASRLHHARLRTVSNYANLILVNSDVTKVSITNYIVEQGWKLPQIETIPLGGDGLKSSFTQTRFRLPNSRYFICVGTLEARKNLAFLLNVWRELVRRNGANTPKLMLVGRRGWENGNVLAMLDRSRELAPHVIELNNLPDAALGALIQRSRAVLAPSQVEGFNLPIAEALFLGLPVIASDISAHREVGGDYATRVGLVDGHAWLEVIERMAFDDDFQAAQRTRSAGYRGQTWRSHVDCVVDALLRVQEESEFRND